jgi:arsenate reductase-like glutaredoxin family protein
MKMDKNNQIQAVLDLLKSTPTRKEFLDAFKKVVDHSKTIQATNEKEWGLIHKAHKQLSDSIQRQMSAHIEDSKGHLEKVLKRPLLPAQDCSVLRSVVLIGVRL